MRGVGSSEVMRDLGPHRLLGVIRQDDDVIVCAAVHRELGVARVAKLLLPGRVPAAVERRFLRQARALAELRHPGLPVTFDCGRPPSGGGYVVIEPEAGEPADAWLARAGELGARPAVAAAIVAAVADTCAQLAREGVVHGDLRLANLRLIPGEDGAAFTVKLAGSEEAALRAWRGSAGSPVVPDVRSDVHGLGCLFFELLTGAPPGDRPLAALVPGLSLELQRSIERMLARAPERRYQSMEEIVTAIELNLGRHRSRLAELTSTPDCPPLAPPAGTPSPDLGPLQQAFSVDVTERWVAGALAVLRALESGAREAILRRLVALRRERQPDLTAPTILVAEDDDDTRQSLVELLEDHGYRVIAARHGREAQEYLKNGQRAQCMLMDLWMPEMDGWALAAEMAEGRLPAVPTIVMTAAEPHWGYPSCIVVRKPFDSRHLLGLVRSVSAAEHGDVPKTP